MEKRQVYIIDNQPSGSFNQVSPDDFKIIFDNTVDEESIPNLIIADQTLNTKNEIVSIDASSNTVTATLPTAVGNEGLKKKIIAYDATNTITVNTTSSQEIKEDVNILYTSLVLKEGEFIEVISKGTYWQIVDSNIKKYYWEDAYLVTGQAITANTDTIITLTSATIEDSGRLSGVINTDGTISPPIEGGWLDFTVTFNFSTPATQGYLDVYLDVDGVKYRNHHHNMGKANGVIDTVTATFGLPVKSAFKTNSGTIYIKSSQTITITDKYVAVKI